MVMVSAKVLLLILSLCLFACNVYAGVISVPSGSAYIVSGKNVSVTIFCDPPPTEDIIIKMAITSKGEDDERNFPKISPNPVRILKGTTSATFYVKGRAEGRYYVQYQVTENFDYHVKRAESVIMVLDANDGWAGIQFQVLLNISVFGAGLLFFIWRRVFSKVNLPFWNSHPVGLFEKINYENLPPQKFQDKYSVIQGPTLWDRVKKFWKLPCDGNDVVEIAGLDAALSMRLHLDMGHVFLFLSLFSVGVLIPIHYMSGREATEKYLSVSFQETTIGNVPLQSPWYWGHVAMTYLTAICVLALLRRQMTVGYKINSDSRRLIGPRSVFIYSGLPKELNSFQLKKELANFCSPDDIKAAVIMHDLQGLYRVLDQRVLLRNEYNRLITTYARTISGTIPGCVRWCPGDICCPSLPHLWTSYIKCLPCRSLCCSIHSRVQYSPEHSGKRDIDAILEDAIPRDKRRAEWIQQELESFPSHILELYAKRASTGAAFVVFATIKAKQDFQEKVKLAQKQKASEVSFPWDVMSHRNLKDLEEQPVDTTLLKGLAVRTAPEPDDINWQNLTYKPRSWKRFFTFFFYQCVTVLILCLFSTPTAVLIYMKLDNNSAMYSFISQNTDSIVAKFLSSYLPSLLLISVNWCLLTSLFYMSIFEPWISESERMQSFLKKGFAYLLLSSVILPSIGVTAVYLASEDGSSLHHGSESAYVEKFMFQLCRNFFIAYVCQRAFLGSILQLLRVGERFIYQPWLRSRAVTEAELLESEKPWPFYFGYDYAIVLSTFMVTLLGVVLSPLLTPFGALYFYMKFFAMKYNLVYVHPRNAGRGRVARSAYTIVFVCLVLFEFTVSVVILEVGRKEQFAAMVVLLCATIGFYLGWWRDLNGNISLSLSALRHLQHQETSQDITRIAVLRQLTENLQKREAFRRLASFMYAMREKDEQRAYLNPYEAGLKVFSCIYAQQKLNSDWQYKKFAFNQLKAHAASFKPKPFLKKKN
ncbi:hypothetical protein LEN26_010732 [Aphanomyces euteiches]|nr:hypothetical protein LEN26_010732 [Aphanomyces euteiches]KAH9127444.1 hypothetical protein AeMF1_002257 [Aphanomyces euteiches]KAH9193125.1 hypothetical protein AeNC1_004902 [Aphanomyces euteiches]